MTASTAEKTVVPLNESKNHNDEKRAPEKGTVPNNDEMSARLSNVQDLLFGDARRELTARQDHSDDRHREFAENTALQIEMMIEDFDKKIEALTQEIRSIDRAQTAKRRKLVGDLGDAIKAMAYDA